MERVERNDVKYGVALRRGTEDVPSDGRYHVLVDGEIVLSTSVEAAASVTYDELREERMASGRAVLKAERARWDAQAFRNGVLSDKATKKSKQGGRGKGGVGG